MGNVGSLDPSPFKELQKLSPREITEKLKATWTLFPPTSNRTYFVPVIGENAQVGAALLLAILAYPEHDAHEKRNSLIKSLVAERIKRLAPTKSPARKGIRDDPELSPYLDIPNKRIQQQLRTLESRLYTRQRAAVVAWRKIISDPNLEEQAPISKLIPDIANWNFRGRAFWSSDEIFADERIQDSFRKQILYPSKPVLHLAMALAGQLIGKDPMHPSVLLDTAQNWLQGVVIGAEFFRSSTSLIFPRKRLSGDVSSRANNIEIDPRTTICLIPYCDPFPQGQDWELFLNPINK